MTRLFYQLKILSEHFQNTTFIQQSITNNTFPCYDYIPCLSSSNSIQERSEIFPRKNTQVDIIPEREIGSCYSIKYTSMIFYLLIFVIEKGGFCSRLELGTEQKKKEKRAPKARQYADRATAVSVQAFLNIDNIINTPTKTLS